MAGVYLHIPFCRQACHYCDFHFSTSRQKVDDMVAAMVKEIELRKEFLKDRSLSTVYFGGGTPSLLTVTQLNTLLLELSRHFTFLENAEITLEANPDDISAATLKEWKSAGINRLSIGVQSFSDEDLRFMNRAHSAAEAVAAIRLAREMDFRNLTIDLIYGTPTMNDEMWQNNLAMLKEFDLPHFSSYALTVEPRTALAQFVRNRIVAMPEEEQAAAQFHQLMQWARENGYEHYEISNFAKPGRYSRHNTAYWQGEHYLGIGPSAHSFNGQERSWNIRNNPEYIRAITTDEIPTEKESLTVEQRYNEYVMTALRTQWGIQRDVVGKKFGEDALSHLEEKLLRVKSNSWIADNGTQILLTDAGKLFADHIASELFR